MAIRLKYDAAAVVIPRDKSQQQFGQQLVQQQMKYANDQREDMRRQMYDQQSQGVQNAANLNLQKVRGQQNLDAQKAQQEAQAMQTKLKIDGANERRRLDTEARDRVLTRNRVNALKMSVDNGEFDEADAKALRETFDEDTNIAQQLRDGKIDEPMAVQLRDRNNQKRDIHSQNRRPVKTPAEVHNENIHYKDPRTGMTFKPDAEQIAKGIPKGWVFWDPKTNKETAPPTPEVPPAVEYKMSEKEYWLATPERRKQIRESLAAKEGQLKEQIETGEFKLPEGVKLKDAAWAQIQEGYKAQEQWEEDGLQDFAPSQPAASGQTAQTGQQLAPTAMPVTQGGQYTQAGQKPWVAYSERSIGEEFVDLDGTIVVKTPSGPMIKGKVPPGTPLPVEAGVAPPNEYLSQTARDVAAADSATMDSVPPLPYEQAVTDILFPPDTSVAAAPAAQPQSMAQPQTPAQSQGASPAMDMIGEVNKTFESGTPEQKAMLRDKFTDQKMLSSLDEQATAGNADAEKALEFLGSSLTVSEVVADKIRIAKKDPASASQMVDELKKMKVAGKLDDADYTAAIVENSGKTAKQSYEDLKKSQKEARSGDVRPRDNFEDRAEWKTINAIWDEMGMYDSRSYVKAFQKEPTIEEVINHAATKGKMSRKDAEEWFYSQILARNYAGKIQKQFEDQLGGNSDTRRIAKQDKKRDTWAPSTK